MKSTIDYSIKEGENVIADIKIEVSGTGGGGDLGAAIRTAQKKTNEILTEVVERHRAAAGGGDQNEKDAENDDNDEEADENDEPDSKKLKQ